VLFPQLYGKCQGITRQDGAWPALFQLNFCFSMYLFFMFYVLFVCFCRSVYCLCVNMYCTVLLPLGVNPLAVNKYINIDKIKLSFGKTGGVRINAISRRVPVTTVAVRNQEV
jgi:hypothetical protein